MAKKISQSPEFLKEMEKVLLDEKGRLESALDRITGRKGGKDNEAAYPDYGEGEDENAMEVAEFSSNLSLEGEIEKGLRDVEAALKRLHEGTYGIDKYTNELISEDRLRARPTSNTSVESKKTLTQEM